MNKTVIIGSQNPVKINATKEGFSKVFPKDSFVYTGLSVPSHVSDQPMSDAETLMGAKNRSRNAQEKVPNADFWVGIEGGVEEVNGNIEVFAWIAICNSRQEGASRTCTFTLPLGLTTLLHQGIELGHANDIFFGEEHSKQKGGAVGSLTNQVLGRTEYYVQPVLLALIPFLHPELYIKDK
jgi:inosine/xanthosine triphosphatase